MSAPGKLLPGGMFRFEDWAASNPDDRALHDAMWKARYDLAHLTQTEAYRILSAASTYCYLAGVAPTTEGACAQLRAIRRAVLVERKKVP